LSKRKFGAVSGAQPSEYCPSTTTEIFASDQLPLSKEDDLWKTVEVDSWTNLAVSPACDGFSSKKLMLNVTDKWAKKWITETDQGKAWAEKFASISPVVFVPTVSVIPMIRGRHCYCWPRKQSKRSPVTHLICMLL
jgi:hypothetical protein